MNIEFFNVKSEKDLFEIICNELSNDFLFLQQVNGINMFTGKKVRIDLLAHPLPHIVQKGFADEWFGIELKIFQEDQVPKDEDTPYTKTSKINKLMWQCHSYTECYFNTGLTDTEKWVPLLFVMMFPNFVEDPRGRFHEITQNFVYGNVGILDFAKKKYRFNFASQNYFSSDGMGNPNVGVKKHIGTPISGKNKVKPIKLNVLPKLIKKMEEN